MIRRIAGIATALLLPTVVNADGMVIDIGGGSGGPIITSPESTSIDLRWGDNGYVTFTDQSITVTAMDRAGRLLVAGQSASGSHLRRLLASGKPDTRFGTNGTVSISLGDAAIKDMPVALVPMADGSLYILINHDRDPSEPDAVRQYSLLQVSASGIVASSNGVTPTPVHSADGLAADAIRDAEGRFYVMTAAGVIDEESGKMPWALKRLLANGTIDTGFSADGMYSWSSNYPSAMASLVGDRIEVRYFDPDNECPVRALYLNDSNDMAEDCEASSSGYPIDLFSMGTPASDELQAVMYASNLDEPPAGGPYLYPLNGDARAHPQGLINLTSPREIEFRAFTLTFSAVVWRFDDSTHTATTTGAVGTKSQTDPEGGLYISFNKSVSDSGYEAFSPPSTLFHTEGKVADTTPISPEVAPSVSVEDGYYVSTPITITGLGDNVSVPVRVTGGEVSRDGSEWHSGWMWVTNGATIRVRYTDEAGVTIGGIIAPSNPSMPIGNVLAVHFDAGNVTLIKPKSSSSGGGSADLGWLLAGGILLVLRRRLRSRG